MKIRKTIELTKSQWQILASHARKLHVKKDRWQALIGLIAMDRALVIRKARRA